MKKFVLFSVLLASLLCVPPFACPERYPLGNGDIAVKVEYLRFTDNLLKETNAENGIFLGVEAYRQLLFPGFYLGMEIGWAGSSGDVDWGPGLPLNPGRLPFNQVVLDTDVNYVPIEFNAKYAFHVNPFLTLDLGAGLSVNYFDIDLHLSRFPIPDFHDSDWVFGGQFFADLNYNFQNWFVGIGVKYQLTQELALGTPGAPLDPGSSADNLRLGVKAGVMF